MLAASFFWPAPVQVEGDWTGLYERLDWTVEPFSFVIHSTEMEESAKTDQSPDPAVAGQKSWFLLATGRFLETPGSMADWPHCSEGVKDAEERSRHRWSCEDREDRVKTLN